MSNVVISICCRDFITAETVRWVAGECARHLNYRLQIVNTPFPVDHQRNLQIRQFLADRTATHLFLLDSDEVPQRDTIETLLSFDEPVIAAPSYRWDGSRQHMMMWDYDDEQKRFVDHEPCVGKQAVDGVGVSGLLLERSIVEQLTPIRFAYTDEGFLSLDDSLALCKQLMALGRKVTVICDLVQVHLKTLALPLP